MKNRILEIVNDKPGLTSTELLSALRSEWSGTDRQFVLLLDDMANECLIRWKDFRWGHDGCFGWYTVCSAESEASQ